MTSLTSRPWIALCSAAVSASLLLAGPTIAQTLFTDVTEEANLRLREGQRAAFGDYDNDGWPMWLSGGPRPTRPCYPA